MLPPAGPSAALLGFIAALFMLVLSHSVPMMILTVLLAGDLLITFYEKRRLPIHERFHGYKVRYLAFALTFISMAASTLMIDKGAASSIRPGLGPHVDLLLKMIKGACLGVFNAHSWLGYIYTVGLLVVVTGYDFLTREADANLLAAWSIYLNRAASRRGPLFPHCTISFLTQLTVLTTFRVECGFCFGC